MELIHRSRFGASVMARDSVRGGKPGELAERHDEPWIDPCASCDDRFED
jgi:hypothetical protein